MPQPKVYRNTHPAVRSAAAAEPVADDLTYDELYALAKKRKLKGRSDMTKDELVAALGET